MKYVYLQKKHKRAWIKDQVDMSISASDFFHVVVRSMALSKRARNLTFKSDGSKKTLEFERRIGIKFKRIKFEKCLVCGKNAVLPNEWVQICPNCIFMDNLK